MSLSLPCDRRELAICGGLILAVALVFGQTAGFEFLDHDDDSYVTANPAVQSGLTTVSVRWALISREAANWHPLTWYSHMVDVELFGLDPRGHHLMSVAIHAANAVLLFLLLHRASGVFWPAAWAAAVFALHPLRAESVAWIAERKDVLSALCGLGTLAAYGHYVRRSTLARYLAVALLLTLALSAKPVMVTLPALLLVVDIWPLGRWRPTAKPITDRITHRMGDRLPTQTVSATTRGDRSLAWLMYEKVPLFVLAGGAAAATFWAQSLGGAVSSAQAIPLLVRIEHALVGYVTYPWRMIWPQGLSFVYPHSAQHLPSATVLLSAAMLVATTLAALALWRGAPYFLAGWLWYLIALLPMSGLVQVGLQTTADRYTYWPMIGLIVAAAWGAAEVARRFAIPRPVTATAATASVIILALLCWQQVGYWRDTFTLTDRALELDPKNYVAHHVRAGALAERGQWDAATEASRTTLSVNPGFAEAHVLLALCLIQSGDTRAAAEAARRAVTLKPESAMAHYVLGSVSLGSGDLETARRALSTSIRLDPTSVDVLCDLVLVSLHLGDLKAAERHARRAVELAPQSPLSNLHLAIVLAAQDRWSEVEVAAREAARGAAENAEAYLYWAQAVERQGKLAEAVRLYDRCLELRADWPEAANNLAWLHATADVADIRDAQAAVRLAEHANLLTDRRVPDFLDTLAAAYGAAERWDDAVATAQEAIRVALASGRDAGVGAMRKRLETYRARIAADETSRAETAQP